MRTLRQIQAARANGKNSKGPITVEGKAKVARNAIKHGITTGTILLGNENEERFQTIHQSLCDRFQPEDEAEALCVEEMAWAKWRLRRAVTYETAMLQQELDATTEATHQATKSANAWANLHLKSPGFRNLTRYETIHRRAYTRALEELHFLQNMKLQNKPDTPQTGEEEIAA